MRDKTLIKESDCSVLKNAMFVKSADKLMTSIFWNAKGIVGYLLKEQTIFNCLDRFKQRCKSISIHTWNL